ncbi:MAG: glycosyltransferase family 2 protein, partial [Patescibacteria group bacterium]
MKIYIVIPNWNGKSRLKSCLDAVKAQSLKCSVVVVDNGSKDGSVEYLKKNYPEVELIEHKVNKGFAGGVNAGIKYALDKGADYIALLNNDAVIDKDWAKEPVNCLEQNSHIGAATCKLLGPKGGSIDSTGDQYSIWGLPIARQRGEAPE